ncbi:MAG: chemotaxis protein CheW, partial [Halobacteriovoraceae bacterium]|nr:chemotaxis protein CheW [Halobacteriovoraceae bacterium]
DATPEVQAKGDEAVVDEPITQKKEKSKEEKVTVSESLLAHFLEMSGELTVIRNSIFKSLARVQEKCQGDRDVEHLVDGMGEMQKVSGILQNQIAEMKKVGIETVYRPMRRVVRDSCSVLNKEIDFEIQGEDLKIDTTVAKLLNGALVHLLRNGVDHGIESSEEREKTGKNPEGKLILNSYQTGEDIIVEIIDDGKGLNKEVLKKKALEKGLFTEKQLSTMSDQRIYSIIFESGFSTNTEVTSVSGRGVGMDMVRSSIEEFGGKILIDSELGKGTKFILVIPIPRSILIIKSLMVSCEHNKFNIPLDDVDEVVLFDKSKKEQQIYKNNGSVVLKHHNILCPLISLGNTLGLSDQVQSEFDMQNIVIVKGEGFRYGILVDAIEDIEEIVVKKLSTHFDIQEYLGTTFADDGALSMILDCKGIANRYGINNLNEDESNSFLINKTAKEEINEFMRFSLESIPNCALPLEWVFRLEEIETQKIQFTGNTAIVRYRGGSLPLLHIENLLGMTDVTLEDIAKEDLTLSVLVVRLENRLFGAIIKELQ